MHLRSRLATCSLAASAPMIGRAMVVACSLAVLISRSRNERGFPCEVGEDDCAKGLECIQATPEVIVRGNAGCGRPDGAL